MRFFILIKKQQSWAFIKFNSGYPSKSDIMETTFTDKSAIKLDRNQQQ